MRSSTSSRTPTISASSTPTPSERAPCCSPTARTSSTRTTCRSRVIRALRTSRPSPTSWWTRAGTRRCCSCSTTSSGRAGRPCSWSCTGSGRLRRCGCASRDAPRDPADISDTFDDALAEFHRLEGITRVQVAGFDRDGVAAVRRSRVRRSTGSGPHACGRGARPADGWQPVPLGRAVASLHRDRRARAGGRRTGVASPDARRVRQPRERALGRRPPHRPAAATGAANCSTSRRWRARPSRSICSPTVTDSERGAVLELLEPAIASATIDELGPGAFGFAHAHRVARGLRPHDHLAPRRAPSRGRARDRTADRHRPVPLRLGPALRRRGPDRRCGDRGRGRRARRRRRDALSSRSKTRPSCCCASSARVRARCTARSCSSVSPRASCRPATRAVRSATCRRPPRWRARVNAVTSWCAPRSRSRKPAGGWASPATRPRRSCARRYPMSTTKRPAFACWRRAAGRSRSRATRAPTQ